MDGSSQLTEVRFSEKRRGYDPDEVDNFLERVGEKVYELQEKIRAANTRADEAERRLAEAERRAASAEREARSKPTAGATTGTSAEGSATKSAESEELEETLKNAIILAQRTADTAIKEAKVEAARIMSEAEATAAKLTTDTETTCKGKIEAADREAQRRIDAASQPLKTQVLQLEKRQHQLDTDVSALEAYLESQRIRITDAVNTLQAVIDDPARFRLDPRPKVDTTTPDTTTPDTTTPDLSSSDAAKPDRENDGESDDQKQTAGVRDTVDLRTPAPATAPDVPPRPAPAANGEAQTTNRPLAPRPVARAQATQRPSAPPRPTTTTAPSGAAKLPDSAAPVDPGPPTAPIDLTADPLADDDSFLDELRKAVGEGAPESADETDDAMKAFFDEGTSESEIEGRRARFGRRG